MQYLITLPEEEKNNGHYQEITAFFKAILGKSSNIFISCVIKKISYIVLNKFSEKILCGNI